MHSTYRRYAAGVTVLCTVILTQACRHKSAVTIRIMSAARLRVWKVRSSPSQRRADPYGCSWSHRRESGQSFHPTAITLPAAAFSGSLRYGAGRFRAGG